MPSPPIDPLTSPKYALEGRVVTMNPDFTVLDRGVIYIETGTIVAVEETGDSHPPGFEDAPLVRTGSTIYPGLIELHNHLSYNVLPLWDVPQAYTNRSKWAGTPIYQKLVTGPMKVLGQTPEYVAPLVRYVECKCLLGGVTTSQGIALFSNQVSKILSRHRPQCRGDE
jgi:cytosine/adenosine deaminase-related metal-dependent hydrolase